MQISSDSRDRLTGLDRVGIDPGSLRADIYIPKTFPKNGPLVVILHSSNPTAENYNNGSGSSTLADECGVALLLPGQRRTNNPIRGFNWLKPGDSHRGGGEVSCRSRHEPEASQVAGEHVRSGVSA